MSEDFLRAWDYKFPASLVAQKPARPRDAARLLAYDRRTGKTSWDVFHNLAGHLPAGAVLVMNKTKVIPARLVVRKPTGGTARILYLGSTGKNMRFLSDRRLQPGSHLELASKIYFDVLARKAGEYVLRPSFALSRLPAVLARYGQTPIPPYIKHSPLKEAELRREYQTVFAETPGSVAAPTAALHFTPALIKKLRRRGIDVKFVTLHVNLGTFATLTEENIKTGQLHSESYFMDKATAAFLNKAKRESRSIIAVGTTSVRTLESAADSRSRLRRLSGETRLFIRPAGAGRPKYKFRFVDGLITNFHVPRSSLLMLVASLVGREKLLSLYRVAIRRKFRLFSFGDAMLIK